MKKEKTSNNEANLKVGTKIFYYDGYSNFNIEEVIEVKSDSALLSNNATIELIPGIDGNFAKLNPTKSVLPKRDYVIRKLDAKTHQLYKAIMSKKRITNYLFNLNNGILKKADSLPWDRWSESMQEDLINICGHIAKAMEDEPLTEEERANLKRVLEQPIVKNEENNNQEEETPLAEVKIKKNKKRR
jgi:hypothetical protein